MITWCSVTSLALIILLGSLAAYALARWNSRFSRLVYFTFILGLLIPIRLGTISIIQIIISLKLNNTLFGLIPIYVAMGIPIAILVITAFIRSHGSIKEMEALFGISYPTVKNRLNRISQMLEFVEINPPASKTEILEELDRGEISVQEAVEKLRGKR